MMLSLLVVALPVLVLLLPLVRKNLLVAHSLFRPSRVAKAGRALRFSNDHRRLAQYCSGGVE